MKATGIVRRIDDLGRIVIPKELRTTLGIKDSDPLEFYMQGDGIVLVPYRPGCVFCGESTEAMVEFKGQRVCRNCVKELGAGFSSPV